MTKQKNIIWIVLITSLMIVFAARIFIEPHTFFKIEDLALFYVITGFISSVFLVVIARLAGIILKRRDSYYKGAVKNDE